MLLTKKFKAADCSSVIAQLNDEGLSPLQPKE